MIGVILFKNKPALKLRIEWAELLIVDVLCYKFVTKGILPIMKSRLFLCLSVFILTSDVLYV